MLKSKGVQVVSVNYCAHIVIGLLLLTTHLAYNSLSTLDPCLKDSAHYLYIYVETVLAGSVIVSSTDPDETPHSALSDLHLHCFQRFSFVKLSSNVLIYIA